MSYIICILWVLAFAAIVLAFAAHKLTGLFDGRYEWKGGDSD